MRSPFKRRALVYLALFCAWMGLCAAPGLLRSCLPGPFDGGESADITIRSENPGPGDAEVLRERFAKMQVKATVTGTGSPLVVALRGVADVETIMMWALTPARLTIHSAGERDLAGGVLLQVCGWPPTEGAACTPVRAGPSRLSNADIQHATTMRLDDGHYAAHVTLTERGARTLAALSPDWVGQDIVVAADGKVVTSMPMHEPLRTGRFVLQVAGGEPEAQRMAVAFRAIALQGDWSIVSIVPAP